MAVINLNVRLLRDGTNKEIVAYLNELRQNNRDITICQSLFELVDKEYIPPQIFSVFLPWSKCYVATELCIRSSPSCFVRNQGIKQFGKALIDAEEWEPAWEAIGGTNGIVDLCAELSVIDVKALLRAIGRCNIGLRRVEAREKAIEELLHALLPLHYREYAGSKLQNDDERPLERYCAQVVPACSPEFVEHLLNAKDQTNPLYLQLPVARLIKTHEKLLRKRTIEAIFGERDKETHLEVYLNAFSYNQPPMPSPDSKTSASMVFSTRVLELLLENNENDNKWPTSIREADIFFSLLRRSLKRKLPAERIHSIFLLGLELVQAKAEIKLTFKAKGIWTKILSHWKEDPVLYEDTLELALRLELGGTQKTIGQDYLQSVQVLGSKKELRWPLLRLYCLQIPKNGIDINVHDDMHLFAKQPWSTESFRQLDNDQAVRLLQGLYAANPEYSFLRNSNRESILASPDVPSQRNFNAVLFLTLLQRSSEQIQTRAESAISDLRKKASMAKEQSDRAKFAKAASAYVIATGNLDLYSDIIIWQQRFIRDPLTSKVLFGKDAVATMEGIDLLSGIPQPLPENLTLTTIASRVVKANEILMTFHETMLIAKREPSFYQPDWAGVSSLFGSVINKRVLHAKDLQKRVQGSEADIYTAIWSGTLALLDKVSVDFLNQAYTPIRTLLKTLSPTVLATTTKAMLDAGTDRRKKQDRQPGDHILERLSYEILLQLSKGDKPELAQQLVLQTILDRPDASSWHRQLLSVKFMKRLSAENAHKMLLAFATAIGEKLEEQSYVQIGVAQTPQSGPPQSLVKVTTVKYLAQLLDSADFLSADAAVEILVELFKSGTHRDIRLATLDSLLSLLSNLCVGSELTWKTNPLVEKIMEALETVIPVVGSVNERRLLRSEDWKEARETGTLPEISDISAGLPPLLNAIVTAPHETYKYPGLKNLQAEFVVRYLLPALELSQAEHRKWIALFLAKHNANLKLDDLPSTPISPQFWDALVGRYPDFTPRTVLEDFNKHIVMTINVPSRLKSFNQSLRRNMDLRNTPEVQHWLSVFDDGMKRYASSGTDTLVSMIYRNQPHSLVRNGISFGNVQGMVLQHASLFLDQYDTYADIWTDFTANLRPPSKLMYPFEDRTSLRSMVSTWQNSGKIVLEKVTTLVLEMRSNEIQKRERRILPSATKLLLWLLPYPCFPDVTEVDHECRKFVRELERLLESFLEGDANVLRWPSVAKDSTTISEFLNTNEERLCVAYHVGGLVGSQRTVNQTSLALNLVRIVLAMRLIDEGKAELKRNGKENVSEENKFLAKRLKSRIEEWQGNSHEEIREKVADWKKENKELWKTLTAEDDDIKND
jgi:hypothetical protein